MMFNHLVIVPIDGASLIDAYVRISQIDATWPTGSRNLGKNDIWIASTTLHTGLPLLTTDADFCFCKVRFRFFGSTKEKADKNSGYETVGALNSLSIRSVTPDVANSAATRMLLRIARSSAEPCVMMQGPRTPSSGAPPYSD